MPKTIRGLFLFAGLTALAFFASCKSVSKEELPQLIRDLKSSESTVRNQAAMKLAGLEGDGAEAVPALIAALYDPNGGVRSSAAFALRKIGTPAANKALDDYKKK